MHERDSRALPYTVLRTLHFSVLDPLTTATTVGFFFLRNELAWKEGDERGGLQLSDRALRQDAVTSGKGLF
jgi:hypothetical protein